MYKIMIIEDDLVMAEAIAKEMNAWGNEAVYVKNFQNVLSFFAAQAPHLVLMDITLPFYNGIPLVQRDTESVECTGDFYFFRSR